MPEPVYPVETAALLKFAFTRNLDPSLSNYNSSRMTPIVLATGDAELLDLWIKCAGESLVGDLALIVGLLERDRVAEAVALAPKADRGLSSSGRFTSHMELLVEKLRSDPTPQAFLLRVRLCRQRDAHGDNAPAEKYGERQIRLAAEFERMRGSLTAADRADLCLSLNLSTTATYQHVPALDEFANESVAREFQKLLASDDNIPPEASLFVPAVCSRVHANDLSGISLLASAIVAAPPRSEIQVDQNAVYPVQPCLVDYANRLDAKLPAAAVEAILTYAQALAASKNPTCRGMAAQYVHLAATDATSLAASLKRCGLEGVKPTTFYSRNSGGGRMAPPVVKTMIRVALLHPISSEALLESLGAPLTGDPTTSALLPSLQEPELRARISPAFFLQWNRHLKGVERRDLDAMNLYATERRGDFDEAQRAELDGLLERWENVANSMTPAQFEDMRYQLRLQKQREEQLEQQRRYMDRTPRKNR